MTANWLQRSPIFLLATSIIVFMLVFLTASASAKTNAIQVNYLNVIELNNELRLDAEIAYELNSEVREALINGIPLIFQVEVQVVYLQNWFWDKVIATAVKTHLLKYHILSKQYLLENLETGESDSFPDLESVLKQQGRVSAMHISKADYLNLQQTYVVKVRSQLLTSKLPLPLRMKSYFSPKWRLDSGWYKWQL
jgi:hypothetical protein